MSAEKGLWDKSRCSVRGRCWQGWHNRVHWAALSVLILVLLCCTAMWHKLISEPHIPSHDDHYHSQECTCLSLAASDSGALSINEWHCGLTISLDGSTLDSKLFLFVDMQQALCSSRDTCKWYGLLLAWWMVLGRLALSQVWERMLVETWQSSLAHACLWLCQHLILKWS